MYAKKPLYHCRVEVGTVAWKQYSKVRITYHLVEYLLRRNLFMVYVISQDGKPLMPCSDPIARLLLKQGKAKVKKREPFTIKLTTKQQITLKV